MDFINCLDHGWVRFVSAMGSDIDVVRNARNSHDASWRAGRSEGSDTRLIDYLWRNKHTTPFEAVTFTFEVKAPIFVMRQWHRHRTWSYNEVSARYTELTDEYYVPALGSIGVQSTTNKQGRDVLPDAPTWDARHVELAKYRDACNKAFRLYGELIYGGWPRELARCVLPVGTYTKMFATCNLLNLFRFIGLRDHPHAQHEIRVYAQAMRRLIHPVVPVCLATYDKYAESFSAALVAGASDEATLDGGTPTVV